MIACGFEDVREHKPAVSGKNPVHPVHRCESKIYPCLTMNRFPATRRRGLFQASRAPAPHDGADHSRVKPGTLMAFRGQGQVPVPSPSFFVCLRGPSCAFVDNSFFLLFQTSWAPAPPRRGGSSEGETIGNRSSLRDRGIPSRLNSTPWWPFVVLRGPWWISFFWSFVDNSFVDSALF